ncbi:MAG TPA: DUF2569 domain-containing protein [Terriglobales bacterium]|nr:DUF2569 domain-containing protein [Terriglobales bacterium]
MAENQSQAASSGIGGWLYLVAIGLCLTPIRLLVEIIRGLRPLNPPTWHAVTTPGMPAYHPFFGPLIVGELVTNATLLVWTVVLLYLFFTKRRAFPGAMIAFLVVRLLVQFADMLVARMIPAAAASVGPAVYGALAGGVLVVLIWVPYFQKSRRVATTFIR